MGRKTELQLIGFPRDEASPDPLDILHLLERRASAPQPDEARIAGYLRGGQPYIASPGVTFDALDGGGPIGSGTILTDGVWAWPDDLAHYLETYHIELPDAFVAAIARAGFTPPTLTLQQLRGVTLPGMS